MTKIYLASPFFNEKENAIYTKVIETLKQNPNYDIFIPKEHTIPNGWNMPNHIWAERVFDMDYLALMHCDVVVVLNYGLYSDSGTAWECGCAYGMGKKILNVLCGDKETEYSLMMLNGTTAVMTLQELEIFDIKNYLEYSKNKSQNAMVLLK